MLLKREKKEPDKRVMVTNSDSSYYGWKGTIIKVSEPSEMEKKMGIFERYLIKFADGRELTFGRNELKIF